MNTALKNRRTYLGHIQLPLLGKNLKEKALAFLWIFTLVTCAIAILLILQQRYDTDASPQLILFDEYLTLSAPHKTIFSMGLQVILIGIMCSLMLAPIGMGISDAIRTRTYLGAGVSRRSIVATILVSWAIMTVTGLAITSLEYLIYFSLPDIAGFTSQSDSIFSLSDYGWLMAIALYWFTVVTALSYMAGILFVRIKWWIVLGAFIAYKILTSYFPMIDPFAHISKIPVSGGWSTLIVGITWLAIAVLISGLCLYKIPMRR